MSQRFVSWSSLDGYSFANSVDGYAFAIPYLSDVSCQAVFSGSPVGSVKLQVSNDPLPSNANKPFDSTNVSNWTDVANSSQSVAAAGSFAWDYPMCGFTWIRPVVTYASGSGAVSVRFTAKSRS